jgi:hypothetical protein
MAAKCIGYEECARVRPRAVRSSKNARGLTPSAFATCHRVTTVGLRCPSSKPLTYARSTPMRSASSTCVRPAPARNRRTFRPTSCLTSSDMGHSRTDCAINCDAL